MTPRVYTIPMIRVAIICLTGMTTWAGCGSDRDRQQTAVIDWANENGMRIDRWQAGQLPDENWNEAEWVRRGQAIPDAEAILRHLLKEGDERIEPVLVVQALGYIGTSGVVPLLIEQLASAQQVIRRHVILALGQIGGPEALRTLANQVMYAPTRDERCGAALALKKLEDPKGLAAMESAIDDRQDEMEYINKQLAELRQALRQKDANASSAPASEPAVGS